MEYTVSRKASTDLSELPVLRPERASHISSSSETTTLNDRHDSITSPRSSFCSSSTDSLRTNQSAKPTKRVRFEESVCWSYFDTNSNTPTPPPQPQPQSQAQATLQRKGTFWKRFKHRYHSADSVPTLATTDLELQSLAHQNASMDALDIALKSVPEHKALTSYSVHLPLRECAGRRFTTVETRAYWQANRATSKGDWGDLLSNPRQSRLIA